MTETGEVAPGRYRLTGRIAVDLPVPAAFRLFTARGEQDWVPGWQPHFPVPTEDDAEAGTVFVTGHGVEQTTWVVVRSEPPAVIAYARVTPPSRAGTVTVMLTGSADGGSQVTVAYDLSALTPEGAAELAEFAAGYPDFLRSWEDAIAARVGSVRG